MPDNLTPEQRSFCMSRIKGKDTGLEVRVRSALHRRGLRFRKNVKELPGKPDIVFRKARIAVFLDGDFWHGYLFTSWEDTVSDFWKRKISKNRERDSENHRKLQQIGWTVIRLWQHEVEENFDACIDLILCAIRGQPEKTKSNQEEKTMPTRKVYHVTPGKDGGWKIKEETASRASSSHETKVEAIARAKELAKKQELGQIVIHKQDGSIQTEHTYGKDPYPPKG